MKELQIKKEINFQKLSEACKKYPTLQLEVGKIARPIFFDVEHFVSNHPVDGFFEEFCLSSENRDKVKQYRKK